MYANTKASQPASQTIARFSKFSYSDFVRLLDIHDHDTPTVAGKSPEWNYYYYYFCYYLLIYSRNKEQTP